MSRATCNVSHETVLRHLGGGRQPTVDSAGVAGDARDTRVEEGGEEGGEEGSARGGPAQDSAEGGAKATPQPTAVGVGVTIAVGTRWYGCC